MKICPKCKKVYADNFSFCSICGCSLEPQKTAAIRSKKLFISIIIVAFVAVIGIGLTITEQKKINDTRKEIEDYKYNKALEEYRNTPTKFDMKINNNWTTTISGNYIYIKGTVTNTSTSKTINYFEVEAKFYDSHGNVINSDWTNDGEELGPGESRKFEIMHKYSSDEKDIRLFIKDVS